MGAIVRDGGGLGENTAVGKIDNAPLHSQFWEHKSLVHGPNKQRSHFSTT